MAYVYRHIRLDKNEPFYIGIGETKSRATSRQYRNHLWHNIVAKTRYEVEIMLFDISWEEACKKEIEFIKLYGRKDRETGILANMTDGGQGNLGLRHTAEAIEKIAKASRGRIGYWRGKNISEKTKLHLSKVKTGVKNDKIKGHKVSQKIKHAVSKHSTANKYSVGRVWTKEMREKISKTKKSKNIIACNRRAVIKFDLNMNELDQYVSIAEAHKINKFCAAAIGAQCRKGGGISNGYFWKFK